MELSDHGKIPYARHCTSWEVRDYWQNGKDGECTTDQKMLVVQGTPCAPTPLIPVQLTDPPIRLGLAVSTIRAEQCQVSL
jgi:hypothetical protein